MLKQLIIQSLNGFSVKDVPFLILQLSLSCLLALLIKRYWIRGVVNEEEKKFIHYLLPVQVVFTSLAIFSHQSPWIQMVFAILTLIPLMGSTNFTLRSKVFYLVCIFIAFGCGAANIVVTTLVTLLMVIPVMYFHRDDH